jgi:hypothetical protein
VGRGCGLRELLSVLACKCPGRSLYFRMTTEIPSARSGCDANRWMMADRSGKKGAGSRRDVVLKEVAQEQEDRRKGTWSRRS